MHRSWLRFVVAGAMAVAAGVEHLQVMTEALLMAMPQPRGQMALKLWLMRWSRVRVLLLPNLFKRHFQWWEPPRMLVRVSGMCERAVSVSAIGCDRCRDWFCPSEMCTGMSENATALILSLWEENLVLFVCTVCHVNPGPGTWTEAPACKKGR